MKKRNIHKLLVLAVVLAVLFNAPFVFVFDQPFAIMGIPLLYFSIFFIWLVAVLLSLFITVKKDE